ncbi:MAG: LCP family protein [Thermomicrobia bacterium]|nr:LCP family protein [Thermomicrobia bacterium]
MDDDARKRIRRAMQARQATSPKLRGQYKRAIRAARLEQEANARPESGPRTARLRQTEAMPAIVPPPTKRKSPARWVIALAALPILLLLSVGAYALNIIVHTERAANRIVASPLPRGPVVGVATGTPRPTNTPNPLGTIVPLPATSAAPTTAISTEAPPINFDRKDPFTILMLGVDTREGDTDPSRSDTIILAYVDPLEKHVNLLSIPRDLLVTQAGGFGQAKMSDVYANGEISKYVDPTRGGIALVRDTIEQNFRIQIDYYAQVDFVGFRKIVDAFGGVTVDNPYTLKDDAYPTEDYQFTRVFFPVGLVHLDGDEALKFARTRHDDNDFQRNQRQQQVLLGIRQQALQLNLLSKATGLVDTLGDSVRTDFPRGNLNSNWIGFAKFGTDLQKDAIQQFSLTDLLRDTYINDTYYATLDWNVAIARARQFSPKENRDSIAAQANAGVNTKAKVVVENGTRNGGFANRWSATLQKQGYANATFIDAPTTVKGNVPKTKILYFSPENEKTAVALAKTLGLTPSSVDGNAKRPPEGGGADVLVLLGDDTKEPGPAPACC